MGALKVADNSLDYSLGNTTRQALWLPTSREAKYKAKQAMDTFFVRAGDVAQAGLVFAGERLALTVPAFAAINVVLAGWRGWWWSALLMAVEPDAAAGDGPRPVRAGVPDPHSPLGPAREE